MVPPENLDSTQYAWDDNAQEEVHIGFREDWDNRINMMWTTKLREAAEIAEHSSWGRRYFCCKNPKCMVLVETVQGESDRRWCFRRKDPDGNKPDRCTSRDHYVGESSWHWKTVLSVKKYFQRLLDKNKPWMGRTIVKVEREQSRVFANGEFTETLKPDVFIRFDDGEWFAIEVVYTHGPEKHHHEAYKPLDMDENSGPRVIIIDLNQEIPGTITDESHGQWSKDGGMEEALEREASLEERDRRFNERRENLHVGPHRAKTLRARRELAAQLAKDHPHLNLELPLGEYDTTEQVEQAYVEAQRHYLLRQSIDKKIRSLRAKHGSQFDIDAEEMQSVEEVEAYFTEALNEEARQQAAIANLRERFPKLSKERIQAKCSGEEFDRWLEETENSILPLHQHLEDFVEVLRQDASLPTAIFESYERRTINASPNTTLEAYKDELQASLHRELNINRNLWYDHEAFGNKIGEMPTNSQNQIAEWYNEITAYLGECMAHKEAVLNDLPDNPAMQDVAAQQAQRTKMDFTLKDVEAYKSNLKIIFDKLLTKAFANHLSAQYSIPFGDVPRRKLRTLDAIEGWFLLADQHKNECWQIRDEILGRDDLNDRAKHLISRISLDFNRLEFDIAVFRKKLDEAIRQSHLRGGGGGRRGRRKEEFNPFAKDASQEHRRRRERRERRHGTRPPPVEEPVSIQKMDIEDLIKRERKVIESQQGVSKEIEELKLNHIKNLNKTRENVVKRGLKSKHQESLKNPQERARDLSNELSEIQLEIKRRRADDILKERGGVPGMGAANETTPSTQTNTPEPTSKSLTNEDRLAELRRKSEAAKRQSANRSDDS